jgi:hypothetical protein
LCGDFDQGWKLYETRYSRLNPARVSTAPELGCPIWEGQPLAGKTLLLVGEQGLGDQIQFIRFATDLAAHGARVDAALRPELSSIASSVAGISRVRADLRVAPGTYDYWCFCMSPPRWLDFDLEKVGSCVPYLRVDPERSEKWAARLGRRDGKLRVGLVWAGAPRPEQPRAFLTDRRRSISLDAIGPLCQVAGVEWISLQKGRSPERESGPPGLTIRDVMSEVVDFSDTAAIVSHLDLVISVDTSVAHLAGALAKPVWLLSRADGCWRWLLNRDDSPWYPSMRIFRQVRPFEWQPVLERVAEEVQRLACLS